MIYYPPIKRNKLMIQTAMRMNLTEMMMSKRKPGTRKVHSA